MSTAAPTELDAERAYLDAAYRRVLWLRAAASGLVTGAAGEGELLDPESLFERDAAVGAGGRRLASLAVPKERMAVGRLDMTADERFHIGRLAVADAAGDPLIVDWRAPIAEAFYRATPHQPMDVIRRRHFRWRRDDLVGLDDEVFDTVAVEDAGLALSGEGALMAALSAPRSGRMADVVATIQAEQDVIIRRPRAGVLVVQGGPGTGKTAVALHRAAYLLFADRATFRHHAILFVGPNPRFLAYVDEVVPSLGEDQVVLASPTDLGPAVPVGRAEEQATATLKGDHRMAVVLANAVRGRQRVTSEPVAITCGRFVLHLEPAPVRAVVRRARAAAGTHNERRRLVERGLLRALDATYATALGAELRAGRVGELATQPMLDIVDRRAVARLADRVWPLLTPELALSSLLDSPTRLQRAAAGVLDEVEVALLAREPGAPWSDADVALLDELDTLIGEIPERRRARGERLDPMVEQVIDEHIPECPRCGAELTYVHRRSPEEDRLTCGGCDTRFRSHQVLGDAQAQFVHALFDEVSAQFAVDELEASRPADRRYAHVVVDEAQDLTPMQWRAVARRCRTRSFTIVGDLAQGIRGGGLESWTDLEGLLGAAPDVCELTVNYRTPAEVMASAEATLAAAGVPFERTRSVRSTGLPTIRSCGAAVTVADVEQAVREVRGRHPGGTLAVIAPTSRVDELAAADLGDCVVTDVVEAKGLEFDAVVVVQPEDLGPTPELTARRTYVAYTRTTTSLVVLTTRSAPVG